MKKALLAIALAIGAAGLSGCGTVCNLAEGVVTPDYEPKIYGGVQRDIKALATAMDGPTQTTSIPAGIYLLIVGLAVADPVLSLAGDTVTLPLTIYLQVRKNTGKGEPAAPGKSSDTGVFLGKPIPLETDEDED